MKVLIMDPEVLDMDREVLDMDQEVLVLAITKICVVPNTNVVSFKYILSLLILEGLKFQCVGYLGILVKRSAFIYLIIF